MCICHPNPRILKESLQQKVLLEAKGEFSLTVQNIKKYYAYWNKKAFSGKLPNDIPFKISSRDRALGHVKSTRLGSITEFAISSKYKHTEEQFIETLLHEMIHVWQIAVNHTKGGHGADFKSMMNKLNSKFGLNITVTDSKTMSNAKAKVIEEGVWILLFEYTKMGKTVKGFNFYTEDYYAYRHYALFKEDIERNASKGDLYIIHGNLDMMGKWKGYKVIDKNTNRQTYYPIRMDSQWDELMKSGKEIKAWEKKEDKEIQKKEEEKQSTQYYLQLFKIERPSLGYAGFKVKSGSTTSGVNVFKNLDSAKKSAEDWKRHNADSKVRIIDGTKLFELISNPTIRDTPTSSSYIKINDALWKNLYWNSKEV